jgi:transcriptional regulator GlxA family with amidase domain
MLDVANIVFPGFDIMTLSALSVFERANIELGQARYDVRLVSETGGLVRSSLGLVVQTEKIGTTACPSENSPSPAFRVSSRK